MLSQTSHTPAGPKGRKFNRPRASRGPAGGIQKQSSNGPRVDRDGDLVMNSTSSAGRSRGGNQKVPLRNSGQAAHSTRSTTRSNGKIDVSKQTINPGKLHKAIARALGGDRGKRKSDRGITSLLKEASEGVGVGYDLISVRGWANSKASSNPDGGVRDLVSFLQRKASHPQAVNEMAEIKKTRVLNDTLYIFVRPEDTSSLLRLDAYSFAGSVLAIKQVMQDEEPHYSDMTTKLQDMLSRRYNGDLKLLDLSNLATDPEFADSGMWTTSSRQSKIFNTLMLICDSMFTSPRQKQEAVQSVSLARNGLFSVTTFTMLARTFPDLKNLDLSDNMLAKLQSFDAWRKRFRSLHELVTLRNPIETAVPDYQLELVKWFPKLQILNSIVVRSAEQIAASEPEKHNLPIQAASFEDEGTIGQDFLKLFFAGYDGDRAALANAFYDADSKFSLSINMSAQRAPAEVNTRAPSWDQYVKLSRNMTRITSIAARVNRAFEGTDMIREAFVVQPPTRHPDLFTDGSKWCIECRSLPGVPDTSKSPGGVGGLLIVVHGEFAEVNVATNALSCTRSFDRTFILGPGNGPGGIRVINDALVVRAHGGSEAWIPSVTPSLTRPTIPPGLILPQGFGTPSSTKPDEQLQKELLAIQLSTATHMTLQYSGMCLDQTAWSLEIAGKVFEEAKSSLPPEAFY